MERLPVSGHAADVGPDARGRPTVVYSRRTRGVYHGYAYPLYGRDARERRLPVVRSTSRADPSMWYGRIAFNGDDGLMLWDPRTRRVRRLTSLRAWEIDLGARAVAFMTNNADVYCSGCEDMVVESLAGQRPTRIATEDPGSGIGGAMILSRPSVLGTGVCYSNTMISGDGPERLGGQMHTFHLSGRRRSYQPVDGIVEDMACDGRRTYWIQSSLTRNAVLKPPTYSLHESAAFPYEPVAG